MFMLWWTIVYCVYHCVT